MKKVLLVLSALLVGLGGQAQEKNDFKKYEEVVAIESAPKDELYDRAYRWFVQYSKDANATIQLEDRVNGEIVGKMSIVTTVSYKGSLKEFVSAADRVITMKSTNDITISIICKDNRYKYIIERTEVSIDKVGKNYARTDEGIKMVADLFVEEYSKRFESIKNSIKEHMSKPIEAASDDW